MLQPQTNNKHFDAMPTMKVKGAKNTAEEMRREKTSRKAENIFFKTHNLHRKQTQKNRKCGGGDDDENSNSIFHI